jgi:hypothetical protein
MPGMRLGQRFIDAQARFGVRIREHGGRSCIATCAIARPDTESPHYVPYDELGVGGYDDIGTPEARGQKVRDDYETFLSARAEALLEPIRVLYDGAQPSPSAAEDP